MTVSVCMGIYNGEQYIEKQLQSILHQTRQPDEVILCDDGSTDGTAEIVQHFLEQNHLEQTWKWYQNKENKGYPANFYDACTLCTKEIVFLADQDDIWDSRKLEKMCEVFAKRPDAAVVSCRFGLLDEQDAVIHSVMAPSQHGDTEALRQVAIEEIFYKYEWPGMVLAYRNVWYTGIWKKIEGRKPVIPHDLFLCARAAEENAFLQLDMVLAGHRRHANNTGGEEHRILRLLKKKRKLKEITDYLAILRAFSEEKVLQTMRGQEALAQKQTSMQERYDALLSGKISRVLQNAWKQRKNVRAATVICDLLIVKSRG